MDEVVEEFLVESYENLDRIDADLLALEAEPGRPDLLASVFRGIHTIKGTCGFLGYGKLEQVAHAGESLLSKLRDGELHLNADLTSALLRMVDAVRLMLASVEANGTDGDGNWSELLAALEELQQAERPEAGDPPVEEPAALQIVDLQIVDLQIVDAETVEAETVEAETVRAETVEAQPSPELLGEILVSDHGVTSDAVELAGMAQQLGDERRIGEVLVGEGVASQAQVDEALETQREQRSAVADSSIRVDVSLLDDLMNLVSELVLARNQILQDASGRDAQAVATFQRLNLITTELQEAVMRTRMQPIGTVWNKFPRVVRDLAVTCGKQVRVEMEGEQTELDKSIVEAIRDPLTHIIRNSVDHGIEAPDVRLAVGKPPEGRLWLRAFHGSGQVNIEIADDGAGVNLDRVRAKAVERGLVTEALSHELTDREIVNLIFAPGFSTAETVTNVSGRGVGMDVVKTNIEKIGGSVDIHAEQGHGTTVKVKIPLTLAIIPALIITSAGQRYAIPQVNLVELVRLQSDEARGAVEEIHGTPVYRLRGKLLPLVHLNSELGQPDSRPEGSPISIVVLNVDDHTFGLVVDEVNDTEEIVVKALGAHVKSIRAFAGATIMGDGRVALILDILGLARQAQVVSEQRGERSNQLVDEEAAGERTEQSFLLVASYAEDRRLAIPLDTVARLEEFDGDKVELAGSRPVIRYGDRILPLVDLTGLVGGTERPMRGRSRLHVVVHGEGGASVGLVVDKLVDIVEESVEVEPQAGAEGQPLVGAAVMRGGITDVIDMEQVAAVARPHHGGPGTGAA